MKFKQMVKWTLGLGMGVMSAAPSVVQAQQGIPANEGIQWQVPTPAIMEEAKAGNKLVLADFYADWCGYCRMQDATAYQDDRVILMTEQVVATKINEKNYREMIAQHKVNGYPTVVIMDSNGEEVRRISGAFKETKGYVQWLGNVLFEKALPNMNAALEKQPDDIKLLTTIALVYNSTEEHEEKVAELLEKAGDLALTQYDAGGKIEADKNGQVARTFRLLSMYFLSLNDYQRAVGSLHYLATTSSRPREVVAARLLLAENLFQINELPKAIAELESLLKVEGLSAAEKQAAQTALDGYKKAPA